MSDSPRRSTLRSELLELGPTSQTIVAGVYAWAVTVAPVGFGKHGPRGVQNWVATVFATLAFLALVRGVVTEVLLRDKPDAPRALEQSRTLTLFSFATLSLVTWIVDTDALSPVRLGAARGVAGMLGWALFAYASSAPVVEPVPNPARVEAGIRARGRVERGDAIFVGVVAALALALQLVGWAITTPERGILVRVVTLGAGILVLGGAGTFVAARHGSRSDPNPRARVRSSRPPLPLGWVVALVLLIAAGLLYALTQ
jgi:hypothetical protein